MFSIMTNTEQLRVALINLIDRDGEINIVDAANRFFTTEEMVRIALSQDVDDGEICVMHNRRSGATVYARRHHSDRRC